MEIEFNATAKQARAYLYLIDDKTTEIGYGGGAGGGKSWLGCFWIISQALSYSGTAWLIGRKELINLKRTTLMTLFKLFKEYNISETWYSFNQQNGVFELFNGSKIFIMDLSHQPSDPLYTRLGGLELTGAFVDESNEVEVTCISILKTRIGRCKNKENNLLPKILETFNPNKNHVYYRYYKPYKEKNQLSHVKFIPALPTDNPYLDKEYINQLKRADEITKQRLLYGNFEYDDDPSKLFEYDDILDLFTNEPTNKENRYLSSDIARYGKDKTTIFLWQGLLCYKIVTINKNSVPDAIFLIKKLAKDDHIPYSHMIIDEDGVGGGVVDGIDGCKGFVNNSVPITEANYSNLKTECYFLLSKYVKEHLIGIRTEDLSVKELIIEDLEQIKQKDIDKDDKKIKILNKEEIKEIIGRSPDYADALMMRMFFELKKSEVYMFSADW